MILNSVLAVLLVLIDWLTKFFAVTYLKPIGNTCFIKNLVDFTYVENTGIAFGMLKGFQSIILPVTVLIVICLMIFIYKAHKKNLRLTEISLSIISAGATGNILDKIFRGFVVDFIELKFISFPVFNFADICVCIGAVLFAVAILFTKDGDIFADKK